MKVPNIGVWISPNISKTHNPKDYVYCVFRFTVPPGGNDVRLEYALHNGDPYLKAFEYSPKGAVELAKQTGWDFGKPWALLVGLDTPNYWWASTPKDLKDSGQRFSYEDKEETPEPEPPKEERRGRGRPRIDLRACKNCKATPHIPSFEVYHVENPVGTGDETFLACGCGCRVYVQLHKRVGRATPDEFNAGIETLKNLWNTIHAQR